MNKMQMAHDYFMKHVNTDQYKRVDDEELISWSFDYVDAMQAEADKREDKTRPKALLTKDKDGNCLHFNREFGHKKCMDCGASLEEWQPDWSQAPEWAEYWHYDSYHSAYWVDAKPDTRSDTAWSFDFMNKRVVEAPSFGYQGNWQDSLRKRPEALQPEVDWCVAPSWANWWAIRQDSSDALWCVNKPTVTEDCFLSHGGCGVAPSFGFTGSHIVERPQ